MHPFLNAELVSQEVLKQFMLEIDLQDKNSKGDLEEDEMLRDAAREG